MHEIMAVLHMLTLTDRALSEKKNDRRIDMAVVNIVWLFK